MTPTLGRLLDIFEAGKVTAVGASEAEVSDLEGRYDVVLPPDFREYLLTLCPDGESTDDEFTDWWPISRIRNVVEEYDHGLGSTIVQGSADKWLFFADGFIWAWAWAICCAPDHYGQIIVFNDAPKIVANSFSDFVEIYASDYHSLI